MAHRLAPQARVDLDQIWDYVATASDSEELADRIIAAITRRFYLLAEHPRLGRARDDDFGAGRRSYPADQYVIIYRIQDDDVLVLRVAHGKRDLQALFGDTGE